jgi:dimethylglycine catabolism B
LKKFRFVTVFDLLIGYLQKGVIKVDPRRVGKRVAYHDPCNYGRKAQLRFGQGFFEEPRWILSQCVEDWVDLYPNRMNQMCCGGGGGALTSGYNDERLLYGKRKMEQIKAAGAEVIAVPCHSCHGQLEDIKKHGGVKNLEVKYLWELVADALDCGHSPNAVKS